MRQYKNAIILVLMLFSTLTLSAVTRYGEIFKPSENNKDVSLQPTGTGNTIIGAHNGVLQATSGVVSGSSVSLSGSTFSTAASTNIGITPGGGTGNLNLTGRFETIGTSNSSKPCNPMTEAQRNLLSGEQLEAGSCIFNTDTGKLNIYSTLTSSWTAAGGGISAWLTGTAYKIGDVVIESYKIYVSLTDHTSGVFATDLAALNWQEVSPMALVVGTIDSQAAAANGATASGANIYLQSASATAPGLVNITSQTFSGVKTFSSAPNLASLTASRPLKLDGSKNVTATTIDLSSTNDVGNTLDETNGGTGQNTVTSGDTLYGSASNTFSKLAIGTKGQVSTVASSLPSWKEPDFDIDNVYQEDFEGATVAASLSTGDNATILGAGAISGTVSDETTNFINGASSVSTTTGLSIKYTQAAGSLDDYICGPEIDLGSSTKRKEKQNFLGINFIYLYDGASGDIKSGIYDVTNSTFLATSLDVLNAASIPTRYSTSNYIPSTTQKIRWCFQTVVANNGKILYFDDVQITNDPYKYVKLTNSTPWATYTPTTQGVGSPTITRAQWRIVGDSIEIQARFTTGTVTGSEFQFGLPGTYAVNTGLDAEVVGYAHRNATTEAQYPVLATADDTFLNIGFRDATTANVITPKNGSYLFGNTETVTINATVPIKNLSYSVESIVTPANAPKQRTLTVTGTNYTDVRSVGTYYRTSDGAHRLKFNIVGTVSPSSAGTDLTISGVTFKNTSNFYQAVTVSDTGGSTLFDSGYTNPGASTITISYNANVARYLVSGDVELDARPTWADEVSTTYMAYIPANILTSPESTHTSPKVCSFKYAHSTDTASQHYGSCLNSTSGANTGTGITTFTWKSGYWTVTPNCTVSAFISAAGIFGGVDSLDTSTIAVRNYVSTTSTDGSGYVICQGY